MKEVLWKRKEEEKKRNNKWKIKRKEKGIQKIQ